jgi:tRNA-2-methylthio-N6-dimethylallyladenosine synthase
MSNDKVLSAQRPTITRQPALPQAAAMRPELRGSGTLRRYMIRTYGCQMNEHDTEIMAGLLSEMGYTATTDEADADVILFNTCAVRENAENKVFGEIGRVRPLKNRNPHLIVGLCGCMAQEEAVRERIRTTYPWVDLVFGTHNIERLPDLLEQAQASADTVIEVWEQATHAVDSLPRVRKDGVRAWVNIQYGCNKFCTYCIVPFTRGRERSRERHAIVSEVADLAQRGYREVTLLGQNVNDYGLDQADLHFSDLLRDVSQVDGIERVRFTTSNPWNFTDDLIDVIAVEPAVCEHIHLPVQAGSDRVLRCMNRGYTRDYYVRLVERIRNRIPDVCLSTDIIVGFPGETEADFAQTLELVRTVRYDFAYTFVYSLRSGTPAARLPDAVPEAVARERLQRLMELQNGISLEASRRLVGATVEVMIEGPSRTDPNVLSSRTRSNRIVLLPDARERPGELVSVRIKRANTWTLYGQRAGAARGPVRSCADEPEVAAR